MSFQPNESITPVILAGGTGSRLWPLSRASQPKQFLPLKGEASMLQDTINRLSGLSCLAPITICSEEHRFFVARQLQEVGVSGSVILEPEGRNTAPAIALAALFDSVNDPLLLVLPADHVILDESAFTQTIERALPLANAEKLVTFGVIPTSAQTGYGYIEAGKPIESGYFVDSFKEKPSADLAETYISAETFFWNSGIFLFRARKYLSDLREYRKDIYDACKSSMACATNSDGFLRIGVSEFLACPGDSIDYAVMERTKDAVMVPLDAGWNDVGAWSSLWDIGAQDSNGNVVVGDVLAHETSNSYIRAEDKLVATLGVDELVVVDTKDAILVADKKYSQDAKVFAGLLQEKSRNEWNTHREVKRPWGKYDSVDSGSRHQVKRITVDPGAKLSVQLHHHRSEHWICVSGTGRVLRGEESFLLSENESTYIPVGLVHALENPGKVPLEIIEIQIGQYLEEDDIVRFQDIYGRLDEET